MREWGLAKYKGKSLWWPIQSRNKKGRGKHQEELDNLIANWTKTITLSELIPLLDQAGVPAGGIYSMEDIAKCTIKRSIREY